MRISTTKTITGKTYGHVVKCGPMSEGYIKRLFNIPPEYYAALQAESAGTGGVISVNELVRRAIKMYITSGLLSRPIYTGLTKT